jgi:predicted N-acetyltransferase YhbS
MAMPDMLVRLYDLPDATPYEQRTSQCGATIRRVDPWGRAPFRDFVSDAFGQRWADEAEVAFSHQPITAFIASVDARVVGFAVYECTRPNFFGPTGVIPEMRGRGIGAALLFRCLDSMRSLGYAYAIIGGVGPASFYEKVCGAIVVPGSEVSIYGPSV